jgi:hypothetical protein
MKQIIRTLLLLGASAGVSLSPTSAKAAQVLYDGAGFVVGTQAFSDALTLPSAGTLTVTLGDAHWPQPFSSLDLLLSTARGQVGPEVGVGTTHFDVTAAGTYFVQWFGTAQGPLNAGVYSLDIQFQPIAGPVGSPVPLPTSILLLLSGCGLLMWQRRSREEPALSRHGYPLLG